MWVVLDKFKNEVFRHAEWAEAQKVLMAGPLRTLVYVASVDPEKRTYVPPAS